MGDEIMASGEARAARARDSRRVQIIGREGTPRWNELWEGNDDIARPGQSGDYQRIVNGPGVRPYLAGKSATLWTFNLDYRAQRGRLVLTEQEQAYGERYAGRIIVEPHIKAKASPNKNWGWTRWNKLAYLLQRAGLMVTQIGPHGTKLLDGADLVVTPTFRHACAVMARAQAAVLPEGGLHHAAAAFNVPAVVIFGGFIPVELTGYEGHVNLGASGADACGMRVPCKHCEEWMAAIKPEAVADHLMGIIG